MHWIIAADLGKWTKLCLSPNSLLTKKYLKNLPHGNKTFSSSAARGNWREQANVSHPVPFFFCAGLCDFSFTQPRGRDYAEIKITFFCFLHTAMSDIILHREALWGYYNSPWGIKIFGVISYSLVIFCCWEQKKKQEQQVLTCKSRKHKGIDQLN